MTTFVGSEEGLHEFGHPKHVVVSALQSWAQFQFEARRGALDKQSIEIADLQDGSVISRKALADATRTFKKSFTGSGGRTTASYKPFSALLKEYQAEIDRLTARAKFSESAFLELYKALDPLPDPLPLLQRGVEDANLVAELQQRMSGMEAQSTAMNLNLGERAEYESTFEHLRAQVHAARAETEDHVRSAVAAAQQSFMEAQHKSMEAFEARDAELSNQLAATSEAHMAAQKNAEALKTQLFEVQAKLDTMRNANSSQAEMASEDLGITREENSQLRRRCAELENQLAREARPESFAPDANVELASKDVEISHLTEELESLRAALVSEEERVSTTVEALQKELAVGEGRIAELNSKIESMPGVEEYEELKRRTETLKALQLEDSDGPIDAEEGLEMKMLHRLRALESKLTKTRVELMEKDEDCKEAKDKVAEMEELLADQKALVSRLEEGINSMTDEKTADRDLTMHLDSKEAEKDDVTMLAIVTDQRDRFRTKVREVEDESRKLSEALSLLKSEKENLEADNVQLYSKIRYLQSYKQSSGGNSAKSPLPEEDGSSLQKYHKVYEETMNPFTAFNRKERKRRVNELSTAERVTLLAGERMLGTRFSRLFVFVYVILLHLFVFIVLSMSRSLCHELEESQR
ncbi:hypothetical protein NDN08_003674 [Rhodosorus marinus]|uniref:Protein CASP n=1 Tax=Rhodosorus marinus TaxID=101924 RepID=A0AAV8V1A6_9RHOD|nr:hypothetical protein NDN08_003674 [Rhodosorus marinus]